MNTMTNKTITPLAAQKSIRKKAQDAGMDVATYIAQWHGQNSDINNYDLPVTTKRLERMERQRAENALAKQFNRKPRNVCRVMSEGAVQDVQGYHDEPTLFGTLNTHSEMKVIA